MTQEERKMIRIFTQWGGNFGILTRMPYDEIEAEIFDPEAKRDSEWIKLHGIDELDNTVTVWVLREDRRVVMLNKFIPQQPKAIQVPKLVQ